MARLPRIGTAGIPQHIIQRGNNRQICFVGDRDFAAYAHWLDECARKSGVAIHAWVLMSNHVHLLATPETDKAVSHMMQALGRHYVRYFNRSYRRTGTLWEGRFKSCVVDAESYLLICQRYIELNPVRAGIANHPGDYRWSSYRANGLGQPARLWTPHRAYCDLGKSPAARAAAYRALFAGHIDSTLVDQIRLATHQGMALGEDRFKENIEQLSQRRVYPRKRGPQARQSSAEV
jgi:putative transposase